MSGPGGWRRLLPQKRACDLEGVFGLTLSRFGALVAVPGARGLLWFAECVPWCRDVSTLKATVLVTGDGEVMVDRSVSQACLLCKQEDVRLRYFRIVG